MPRQQLDCNSNTKLNRKAYCITLGTMEHSQLLDLDISNDVYRKCKPVTFTNENTAEKHVLLN